MIYDLDIVYLIIFLESLNEYLCSYGWSNSSHIHWLIHCFMGYIWHDIHPKMSSFCQQKWGFIPKPKGDKKNWDCMRIWNQHYDEVHLQNGNLHWENHPSPAVTSWEWEFPCFHLKGCGCFSFNSLFLQLWCADSRVLIQKSHIHFSRPLLFFLGAFVGRSCGQRPKNPWHVWWVQPTGVFYHCGSDRLCVIYFMLLNLICCHCASVG